MDIRQELGKRIYNAARDLHMEMVAAGVDLKELVPEQGIIVKETPTGVSVQFFPGKGQDTAQDAAEAEMKAEAERLAAKVKAEQERLEAEKAAEEAAEAERLEAERLAEEEAEAKREARRQRVNPSENPTPVHGEGLSTEEMVEEFEAGMETGTVED